MKANLVRARSATTLWETIEPKQYSLSLSSIDVLRSQGEFMAAAIDRKIFFREDLCLQVELPRLLGKDFTTFPGDRTGCTFL